MNSGTLSLPYGVVFGILAAIYVGLDGAKLRQQGARVSPVLWALLVLLLFVVTFPLYLFFRSTCWRDQIDRKKGHEPRSWFRPSVLLITLLFFLGLCVLYSDLVILGFVR